jgi:hypothetical protein
VPERLAALDVKVLLGIDAPVPVASYVEAHRLLRDDQFVFCATPQVLEDLEKLRRRKHAEFTSTLASTVLDALPKLDVIYKKFSDTEKDVTEIHVNRVIERGILGEPYKGDLFALVEACYMDCFLFVTTREQLLANRVELTGALIRICGMEHLYIFSPDEIVRLYQP